MSGSKNINLDHLKEMDDLEEEIEEMNNSQVSEKEMRKIDKSREESLKSYNETISNFKKYMMIPFFVGLSVRPM
jgi:predicted Holliday junction resolvase-like endonuclease